jgi:hypothetical protein
MELETAGLYQVQVHRFVPCGPALSVAFEYTGKSQHIPRSGRMCAYFCCAPQRFPFGTRAGIGRIVEIIYQGIIAAYGR